MLSIIRCRELRFAGLRSAVEPCINGMAVATAARLRWQEYLLERGMFGRLSTGEVGDPAWCWTGTRTARLVGA